MNTIYRLSFLFLAMIWTACQRDVTQNLNITSADNIQIVDGMIQSPRWLADEVENIADRYELTPSGEKHYPWVFSLEYNGRKYIFIMDGVGGTVVGSNLYFTLSGEPVVGGSDLWAELHETRFKDEYTLVWRYEYNSTKPKSMSTRADMPISFFTPMHSPVPDTWIRDEWYITPAQISYGRDYFTIATQDSRITGFNIIETNQNNRDKPKPDMKMEKFPPDYYYGRELAKREFVP